MRLELTAGACLGALLVAGCGIDRGAPGGNPLAQDTGVAQDSSPPPDVPGMDAGRDASPLDTAVPTDTATLPDTSAPPDVPADVPVMVDAGGVGLRFVHVTTGESHTCAIELGTRALYCWGDNSVSQIGVDDGSTFHETPQRVGTPPWDVVSSEDLHTCAIKEEGSVWCWGKGQHGRLGGGTTADSPIPLRADMGTLWARVSAGGHHTCATTNAQTLYCWGRNNQDQLGSVRGDGPSITQEMSTSTWLAVASGQEHTCAINTGNSRIWCWGRDDQGQIGTGTGDQGGADPVRVNTTSYRSLDSGGKSTCAIEDTGRLHCWGHNAEGQLGVGDMANRDEPAAVGGSTDWLQVSINDHHACAIREVATCVGARPCGNLFCWGRNDKGQLGNGETSPSTTPSPVSVPDTFFVEVSTGGSHTCAIDTASRLHCWGAGALGQLGNGDLNDRVLPDLVP